MTIITSRSTEVLFVVLLCMRAQSCPTPCNPMVCSPPGGSVHGILQARILEWAAMQDPPGHLPDPVMEPTSPMSAVGFSTAEPPGKSVIFLVLHCWFSD